MRPRRLLILSQVILSLQLSFAVIPLIHFTSNRRNMGAFATPAWGQVLAWSAAAIIVGLNGKLVLDQIGEWVRGPVDEQPLDRSVPALLAGRQPVFTALAVAALLLLLWVTVKPFIRPVAGVAAEAEREAQLDPTAQASSRSRISAWPSSTTPTTPRS